MPKLSRIILQHNLSEGNTVGKLLWVCWWNSFTNFSSKDNKRVHGIKFECLALLNGIVGKLSGPYVGKRHDSPCNTSLGCSQIYRDQYWHNNQPLCIYGDPAYSLSIHLQALFSWQNLTPDPVNYNKATSQTQVYVEYLFHKIKISFKFVSLKSWMKIGLSAIDKIYRICTLLHNPRTCFMGIKFLSFQLIYLGQLALLCYNV